jgi:amino acid adenylation domain-containing protein
MTYAELERAANRLARHLQARGVGPEVRVAAFLERSFDRVVAVLGIFKAGGTYVPMDPSWPAERLRRMLEDARPGALVTHEQAGAPPVSPDSLPTVWLDRDREVLAGLDAEPPTSHLGPDNVAYVIFTSGSTGRPRGVQVTHRGLSSLVEAQRRVYGIEAGDKCLQFASCSFDASIYELTLALGVGATLVVAHRDEVLPGAPLTRLMREEAVTAATLPPTALGVMNSEDFPALRTLMVAGEACHASQVASWGTGRRFFNAYGPTETTVWATVAACSTDGRRPPIGRAVPAMRAWVLDAALRPVPLGTPGELYLGGPALARGYLGAPDVTAERFVPDALSGQPGARLYRTGDRVRQRASGELEFLGRVDRQVKIRGHRIEPGEIEAALSAHPGMQEVAVVAREDTPGAPRLVAYVVARPSHTLEPVELRAFLSSRLPEPLLPSAFVSLAALPLTPNGKVDRAALPAPASESRTGADAPRTPVEEVLATLWAEVLGLARVGRSDNFFDLGGHSLMATRVMSRVTEAFGVELPLRKLFEAPTLEGQAALIESTRKGGARPPPPLERVTREGPLPLSFAQQRMWFLAQLEPDSPFYNTPAAVRLRGPLDVAALQRCLEEIVRRHEVLRTTFTTVDGEPRQRIAPSLSVPLPVVDLTGLPESEREAEALRRATEDAQRPFDLAHGPVLRATVLALGPEEHVALFTLHHIVSDGWSIGVVLRELWALYDAFGQSRPSPLPELTVQYADFASWQRRWLEEAHAGQPSELERQLSWWRERLAGNPREVALPFDRPRPAVRSHRGAHVTRVLPAELLAALHTLGRQESATLFMVVLAAFQAVLSRAGGQEDLTVGTPVANRRHPALEGLIGFFVNTLVLRTSLSGNPTFRELVGRVRDTTLGATAHQDVPFEKLVEALQPERDMAYAPLFQVLFVLQNAAALKMELPGLTLEALDFQHGTSKFDLQLYASEVEGRLVTHLVYATDLFDAPTAARLLSGLEAVLRAVVEDPRRPLLSLELLTEAEREQQRQQEAQRQEASRKRLRSVKPRAVKVEAPPESELPALITVPSSLPEVRDWLRAERESLLARLQRHGALLFRGAALSSLEEFEQLARELTPELLDYTNGSTPRTRVGGKVYTSTEYPADQSIPLHCELAYAREWPLKLWFHCVVAPASGGETPLANARQVLELLRPEVRQRFIDQGVMYVRNYRGGGDLDLSWQTAFQTQDKAEVARYCEREGIAYEWRGEDWLCTRQVCQAVARHPVTGEEVWFNQAHLFHISNLAPEARDALTALMRVEDLPRNAYYGDGSPIEDATLAEVREAFRRAQVSFPWQAGDVLLVDNMKVSHGRAPFTGPRRVVVAMAEPFRGPASHGTMGTR